MQTRHRQSGLTLMGLLFASALIAVVALGVMKVFPLYSEKFKVLSAMKAVAGMANIAEQSPNDIRKFMLRNFEVADVDEFNAQNIKDHLKVQRIPGDSNKRLMTFTYESRAPLIADLDVVLKFNESMEIAGTAATGEP